MWIRIVRRSLRVRPQRALIAVLSVAIGSAVAVAFADLSLVLGDRLAESLRAYGANLILVPEGGSLNDNVSGSDFAAKIQTASIQDSVLFTIHQGYWRNNILGYAPRLAAIGYLTSPEGEIPATIVGTWFERSYEIGSETLFTAGMTTVAPWWSVEGAFPTETPGSRECLLGRILSQELTVSIGDVISLRLEVDDFKIQTDRSEETSTVLQCEVVGILDAGGSEDETLYLPLETLQEALGRRGDVDRVLVSALIKPGFPPVPNSRTDPEAFERWSCTPYITSVAYDLNRTVPGVEARPVSQLVAAEGRVVHRINLLMLLLALAAITGSALGVMSTMTASVVERTQEFALQRALGANRRSLVFLLAMEGIVIVGAGGLLGSGLGLMLSHIAGRAAFGFEMPFHPLVVVLGFVVAALTTALGFWAPLGWVTRVTPAQGLKS